ncbi:hypothetical protein SDJN02_20336, partial [Cucurbita argyrosperma subsp. argyrosperma]
MAHFVPEKPILVNRSVRSFVPSFSDARNVVDHKAKESKFNQLRDKFSSCSIQTAQIQFRNGDRTEKDHSPGLEIFQFAIGLDTEEHESTGAAEAGELTGDFW